jgi:glycosyltransferase involved in cell wall biosynthesis
LKRLPVLVLSRNYPNNVTELLGLWVQGLVRQSARFCEIKVVSPVPYCPPLPYMPETYSRFRRVLRRRCDDAIEVLHPRFLAGPRYSTHQIEWLLYDAAIRKPVAGLRRSFPFELIHAHFTYPDGVVAARLGRRYRVPVVITEQNLWQAWMDRYPSVRRRAIWAARKSAALIAISRAVRESIENHTGHLPQLTTIPDGVNGSIFTLPADEARRSKDQLLFVGAIRPVKGVDILLQAVRLLAGRGRDVQLVLIGGPSYHAYRQEDLRLRKLAGELGLQHRVKFIGKQPFPELVRQMQRSAALVLPSRAESLGMVLVEALACGTPVVATRCGGPEEIVNERVGVLVPAEDPEALASGIEHVLDHQADYDPVKLRAHALENFGLESVGRRLLGVYEDALQRFHSAAAGATVTMVGHHDICTEEVPAPLYSHRRNSAP